MKPYLIGRAMDVVLINALVFGNADVRTFCFWVISALIVLMLIGALSMNAATAETVRGRSAGQKAIRTFVCLLYIAALNYAGFPGLAALYFLAVLILLCAVEAETGEA